MGELSPRREQILRFIRDFMEERGYAPTVRDILKGCDISSPSVVQYHLNMLEKQGYIRRDPQIFRSIQLVEKEVVEVPLLGTIAAGKPIALPSSESWISTPEETVKLTADITGGRRNIYALRVKGTSMLDALIGDGDIVIMEAEQTADDGEMVAVWLKNEQETTLKRIYRERGRIRLQPANEQMEPIYVEPENVAVQGKVVAIIRRPNR